MVGRQRSEQRQRESVTCAQNYEKKRMTSGIGAPGFIGCDARASPKLFFPPWPLTFDHFLSEIIRRPVSLLTWHPTRYSYHHESHVVLFSSFFPFFFVINAKPHSTLSHPLGTLYTQSPYQLCKELDFVFTEEHGTLRNVVWRLMIKHDLVSSSWPLHNPPFLCAEAGPVFSDICWIPRGWLH